MEAQVAQAQAQADVGEDSPAARLRRVSMEAMAVRRRASTETAANPISRRASTEAIAARRASTEANPMRRSSVHTTESHHPTSEGGRR
jgi:hypothetical protein